MKKYLSAAIVLVVFNSIASAALVVYEGFNYSPQADNTALNGSGGTGLSGSWSGWGTYRTRGLTFSDLSVAGGCAEVHSSGAVNALSNAWRQINVNVTGTIWGSFLFNSLSAMGVNGFVGELYVTKAAGGGDGDINLDFSVVQKTFNSTLGHVRLGGDTLPVATVNSGGTALSQSTTYLVLFKVENVIAWGGAAASQTITTWFLSAAQYYNFKSDGLTEAELNSAAQGSGSTNVMQRTTLTATQKASFSVNDFLSVLAYGTGGDYQYDEIRISDASLTDVVPEAIGTATKGKDTLIRVDFQNSTGSLQQAPVDNGTVEFYAMDADTVFGGFGSNIWDIRSIPAYTTWTNNPSFLNLTNTETGVATGIGLSFTGAITSYAGTPSIPGDNLRRDYLALTTNHSPMTAGYTISGLYKNTDVTLFLYCGYFNGVERGFNFTVDGDSTTYHVTTTGMKVTATANSSGQLTGTWSIPGGQAESDFTGFQLYQRPPAGGMLIKIQ